MEIPVVLPQLAAALGLGLLVGLQRQRTEALMAGVRTFPLITILGVFTAHLSEIFGGWLLGAGFLSLAGLVVMANFAAFRRNGAVNPGITTEVAVLLMYAVGAYLVVGSREVAIAVGGGVAVLLHFKEALHRFARLLGETDFRSIIQFVLISLVILPVLPNRPFGPYGVLNLREIWWMVVLIVGMGMAGYLAYRFLGSGTGTLLAGIFGGLISSTATTVSYARYVRSSPERYRLGSTVILIASTVVFLRVLVEVAVVAPKALPVVAPPLLAMLVCMALLGFKEAAVKLPAAAEVTEHGNPSQLRPALIFAGLYALVLLVVATVKEELGVGALYGVAILSGLTDVDAITLSTSQLMSADQLPLAIGWRLILVAAMSNLLFKLGIVGLLGSRRLFARLAVLFTPVFAVGAALLLLWPR